MALRQRVVTDEERGVSSGLSSPLSEIDESIGQFAPASPSSIKRSAADNIEIGSVKKARTSRAVTAKTYVDLDLDVDEVEKTPGKRDRRPPKAKVGDDSPPGAKIEASAPTQRRTLLTSKKRTPRPAVKSELTEETTSSLVKTEVQIEEVVTNGKKKKTSSTRASKVGPVKEEEQDPSPAVTTAMTTKKARKKPIKAPEQTADSLAEEATPKRHRKTKEEKEAEAMPLATRTVAPKILLGAHVSAAGGVHNSVTNAMHIGGNAFALFLKSQRKWENPALKPEHSDQFRILCDTHKYESAEHVIPHGSYLVNLAQPEAEKAAQAYNSFVDDLQRCESLGIRLYNFHPGNTNGEPRAEAIARLAARLNDAHRSTSKVVTLLENMAAHPSGNTLGSTFADLRDIIALVNDKSRVGVCLDTCHAFAAGYDLRTPTTFAATIAEFDATVGFQYLRAVHVNDSKAPFASHRDLHANIGTGFLGLRAFHNLVNDPRFGRVPMVLETPIDKKDDKGKVIEDKGIWAREIKMLEGLVGMDPEAEEFRRMEMELAEQGRAEREKHQEQFNRKTAEKAKKESGGKGRKKKAKQEVTSSSGDDSGNDSG